MSQVKAFDPKTPVILRTVKSILNEGGIKSFWRGNGVNCIKIAPEYAIRFAFYDIVFIFDAFI